MTADFVHAVLLPYGPTPGQLGGGVRPDLDGGSHGHSPPRNGQAPPGRRDRITFSTTAGIPIHPSSLPDFLAYAAEEEREQLAP